MQSSDDNVSSKQPASSSYYESTISHRERNLDHWDVDTAAAYLGLHPETLRPLPRYYDDTDTNNGVHHPIASSDLIVAEDEYIGHDAAILFYAQWDRNSHAVAPTWDAIATHLHAGSSISSNLVMALFDCERNKRHVELCTTAGVQAYPTIMFVGSGTFHDTDWLSRAVLGKDKSAGPFGATTLRRTVKFQGNWQYGDQILDWINIMKGLSSWNTVTESGPLHMLRNGLFRFLTGGGRGGENSRSSIKTRRRMKGRGGGSLPVGVPPHFQSELRGGGGGGSSNNIASTAASESAKKIKNLEKELNATIKEKELYELAATHSNLLLDGLLFPRNKLHKNATTQGSNSSSSSNSTSSSTLSSSSSSAASSSSSSSSSQHRDPFAILTNSDGWFRNATFHSSSAKKSSTDGYTTTTYHNSNNNSNNYEHPTILRSCVLELAIDYCTRLTTRATKVYLEILNAIPESDPFPTLDEIEQYLLNNVKSQEPYCGLIESCMATNFEKEEECRPQKCPFENESACTYVESCLDPNIQNEYGVALGLIEKGETVLNKVWGDSSGSGSIDNSGTASGMTSDGLTTNVSSSVGGWGIPVGK